MTGPDAQTLSEPLPDEGLFFAGRRLPRQAAYTNFMFIGSIGSGKTTLIELLMRSALPLIGRGMQRRVLFYDKKREAIPVIDALAPWVTLNPFDTRCAAWDCAADIDSPASALELGEILFPTLEGETHPFFTRAARDLSAGVILALHHHAPGAWAFADLIYTLQVKERMEALLKSYAYTRYLPGVYFRDPELTGDIIATVNTGVGPFRIVAACWSRARCKVSLRHWLKNEYVLILAAAEEAKVAVDALNQLLFSRAVQLMLAEPDIDPLDPTSRQQWIFLDEVRHMGKLTLLSESTTTGRSRGICTVIGLQDIEGLRAVYAKEVANEIAGQCTNKVVLKLNSPETAQWASELFGSYEAVLRLTGLSSQSGALGSQSASDQFVTRLAVLPSQFFQLPPVGPAHGLHGYFLTAEEAGYRVLPWDFIDRERPRGTPEVKREDRSVGDQYLYPDGWTPGDYTRLRFPPDLVRTLQQAEARPGADQPPAAPMGGVLAGIGEGETS